MSLEKIAEAPSPITSLATHHGVLIAAVSTGQLAYLNRSSKSLDLLLDTHGGPRGLAVDSKTGDVFFADAIRKAVVKLELPSAANAATNIVTSSSNNNNNVVTNMSQLWDALKNSSSSASTASALWQQSTQLRSFIDSFMDTPLKGPHGIAFDARGEIYVSDPGAFGDTGLCNPSGSVLRSIANCQQVVPLAQSGLAYPAGVACNEITGAIFVCELASNRLVRFVSRTPPLAQQQTQHQQIAATTAASSFSGASMFGSVFHQFSGGMGPMCVAVDSKTDLIYVARYDFAHCRSSSSSGEGNGKTGEVVVLHDNGEEAGRILVPGTEIAALALDNISKKLYIAEGKNLYALNLL